MTTEREYSDDLRDMLDAVERAIEFTEGMDYSTFVGDTKTGYAVVRAFEILGEASKMIPQTVGDGNPALPWHSMSRMRDRLIHGYFGVNLEVVWKTVKEDLPKVKVELERLLAEAEQGDGDF